MEVGKPPDLQEWVSKLDGASLVEFPAEPEGWKPGLTEEEVDLYEHPAKQKMTRPSHVGSPKG